MYFRQIAYVTPTLKIFLGFLSKMPKLLGIVPSDQFPNSKIKQFKSLLQKPLVIPALVGQINEPQLQPAHPEQYECNTHTKTLEQYMFVNISWRKLPKLLQRMPTFGDTHSNLRIDHTKSSFSTELLCITFKQQGSTALPCRHNRCKCSL